MIGVTAGQSQLSGWGHYANPTTLFIKKVPQVFMAGDIVDLTATKSPGGTELHFTDGTVLVYMERGNLVPALENVRVWSIPAEGTTIPNGLDYVTIYASYTTKTGKVINAIPAKVPVATPSYMRVIVPDEPLIDEGQYLNTQKSWNDSSGHRGIKSACHIDGVTFAVYWEDRSGRIVRVSTTDSVSVYSSPFAQSSSSSGPLLIMGEMTSGATFTRYRGTGDDGEEITLENAGKFIFRATIKGIVLEAETYFQTNPVVSWGFYDMPDSYSGTETKTLTVEQNSKVEYKDGKVRVGRYDDGGLFYLSIFFRTRAGGGYWNDYTSTNITLADNNTGTIGQYCFYTRKEGTSGDFAKTDNKRKYTCSGGSVTWSDEPI